MFDEEAAPEELTQVRMGKIVKDKYPELDEADQEAVRQHAVAALNLTQKAKEIAIGGVMAKRAPIPPLSTVFANSLWMCANSISTSSTGSIRSGRLTRSSQRP